MSFSFGSGKVPLPFYLLYHLLSPFPSCSFHHPKGARAVRQVQFDRTYTHHFNPADEAHPTPRRSGLCLAKEPNVSFPFSFQPASNKNVLRGPKPIDLHGAHWSLFVPAFPIFWKLQRECGLNLNTRTMTINSEYFCRFMQPLLPSLSHGIE